MSLIDAVPGPYQQAMMTESLLRIGNAQTHVGTKVAIVCDGQLVTYLRDDVSHIPDPGLWDFPGGEREHGETALECVIRETEEEFGITIAPSHLIYAATYKSHQPGRADVAFFVAHLPQNLIEQIKFGDEGQYWRMMPVDVFLACEDAVRELRGALQAYLQSAL